MDIEIRTAMIGTLCVACAAAGDTLLDGASAGFFNDDLGAVLDGTSEFFPACGTNPTLDPAPEPDLRLVADILGGWLESPPTFNAHWSGPGPVPGTWPICDEMAVVFPFQLDEPYENIILTMGVDNGAFVWLNGGYLGGQINPGVPAFGELVFQIGSLDAGTHHLQILLEDHGQVNGLIVSLAGCRVPQPEHDLTGDCIVDGADLGQLLLLWDTNDKAADFNADGTVDGADLGQLLIGWTI